MRESSLQSSVLQYLNRIPYCIAENQSGNASQSGRADINGCYKGQCFRIELKVGDNSASVKQEINLRKWKNAGAIVGVCYSLEEVKTLLGIEDEKKIKRNKPSSGVKSTKR